MNLEEAITKINKEYGAGSIMKMGGEIRPIDVVPTGSFSLDKATGVGGLPCGRITEIYGPLSAGKTTIAYHVMAEAQKMGGRVALIDAEQSFDPLYAQNIGLNVKEMFVSQPASGEEALNILEDLIRTNELKVIVVDSVAALVPRAEIEGDIGDTHIGLQARMMSQAMRKLTGPINRSGAVVIFINQIRMKIGVMYGSPEVTAGGFALGFFASMRLDVRRKEQLKDGEEIYGNHVKVKVVKNKVAPPFREAEFDIVYAEGISKISEVVDLAIQNNVVEKAGAWLKYEDLKWQGKEALKSELKENDKLLKKLLTKL